MHETPETPDSIAESVRALARRAELIPEPRRRPDGTPIPKPSRYSPMRRLVTTRDYDWLRAQGVSTRRIAWQRAQVLGCYLKDLRRDFRRANLKRLRAGRVTAGQARLDQMRVTWYSTLLLVACLCLVLQQFAPAEEIGLSALDGLGELMWPRRVVAFPAAA